MNISRPQLIILGSVIFVILLPESSSLIASVLGVGRGLDAVLSIAVVVLLYSIFRVVIKLEFLEHEITQIVRKIALKEGGSKQQPNHLHEGHSDSEDH